MTIDTRFHNFYERQLTNFEKYFSTGYSISNLQWSPGGETLAFQVNTDIWQIKWDGTGLRKLAESSVVGNWSREGQTLAYVARSAGTDRITLMNLQDLSERTLVSFTPLEGKGGLSSLRWSPTSDELAYIQSSYQESEGWTQEIWKVNTATLGKQLLLRDHKKKSRLDWSADGKSLIFESSSDDSIVEEDYGPPGELWVLEVDSQNAKKIFGDTGKVVTDFTVHSSENAIAALVYLTAEQTYSMWYVEFPEGNVKELFQTRLAPTFFSLDPTNPESGTQGKQKE